MLRCHTSALVERIRSAPGWLDADTICTATTLRRGAARCGCGDRGGAARRVRARPAARATTPSPDGRWGSASSTRSAIAARWAQAELGVGRVAILDWDVHHGNGTQAIVGDDPTILFVSLHQWPFYPGSGGPGEQGETLVNLPLAAGTGDEGYLEAFAKAERAIGAFEPELLLVSAGFDAHRDDPLAQLELSTGSFEELARRASALAPRVAAVLEGGYNLETLPDLVGAALAGFDQGLAALGGRGREASSPGSGNA